MAKITIEMETENKSALMFILKKVEEVLDGEELLSVTVTKEF